MSTPPTNRPGGTQVHEHTADEQTWRNTRQEGVGDVFGFFLRFLPFIVNGDLRVTLFIRPMAGLTGPASYFRFFQNKSVMPACTNNKTYTATYNAL